MLKTALLTYWWLCPERDPGAEPLVRGQGAKPPEAEHCFCVVICLKWWKAAMFMSCFMVINDSDCQGVYA